MLVAITGGIGSGKSTFAKFLSEQGHIVLYADDISKEILANDPIVKNLIIKEFGPEAYFNNSINKEFLSDTIFSNPIKLKKINLILHPRVRAKILSLANEYFKTRRIVFVEAALIFESKIEKMYDLVVLIQANKTIRLERSLKFNKITQKDFNKRNDKQLDDNIKMKKADIVFNNNGSKAELKQKARLLSALLERYC
jgi:dephospho-CoA kinase